ncbi:type IV pilus biogenesis/stability protein PilW [Shewanella avicenniae]|uniref:Type IV pilus biogenesis/stability protein PilW n=1 Tax=Shewanella avicenniae TaxID=2814294 RepID=A0ABX7QW11_9GAMM|nr:type IV pilus biogenesis/stability protein PilW [Shewanella avicenniae]QSX34836.1 type IV pilus biogenesis/stability protein PilW [Shewanella avicenniae]
MKHGLPGILLLLVASSQLAGCVTERTYAGTDTPVTERKFDRTAAAVERSQLGLAYLKKGDSQAAKSNLDRAMEYAPDLEQVNLSMAYYYESVGELQKAEDTYDRAIATRDATGDAANNFGVFLCKEGKYEKSETMFLRAIGNSKYTRTASSYENLGVCMRKAGNVEKARKYFGMALRYEPRRRVSLLEMAELEQSVGNYREAKAVLQRYDKVATMSPESLALAVKIEMGLGNTDAAKRNGVLLLAKFPQSPQAKAYRTQMH